MMPPMHDVHPVVSPLLGRLTLDALLPVLVSLANTSGLLGTTATLNAWAQGDGPFTYQWLKDGSPISGATNQSLRLTGLQASDAGSYAVAVTNAGYGSWIGSFPRRSASAFTSTRSISAT